MPDQLDSLEALGRQLRACRPPSIATLIAMIEDHQSYGDFVKLVRQFLPEREMEILKQPGPRKQMAAFASHFEARYFPLPYYFAAEDTEEYSELTDHLPLIPLGFGYQDYDDLIQNGNSGAMLMTYLFRHPYGEKGARVALGEGCQEKVPLELLQRIPGDGFTPEELHRLLDNTPYQALAVWGDLINLSTGNEFLDTDEEMMASSVMPDWDLESVAYYTRQWAEAERVRRGPVEMMEKFEQQAEEYLTEVLDFIEKRKEKMDDTDAKQRVTSISMGAPRET